MNEQSTESIIWVCPNCDYNVNNEYERCWNCGYNKAGEPPEDPKAFQEAKITASLESKEKPSWSSILRMCGYFDLIAGFIVAFIFWSSDSNTSSQLYNSASSPFSTALGIAAMLQGIFFCALFNVIADIGDDARTIRKKLEDGAPGRT